MMFRTFGGSSQRGYRPVVDLLFSGLAIGASATIQSQGGWDSFLQHNWYPYAFGALYVVCLVMALHTAINAPATFVGVVRTNLFYGFVSIAAVVWPSDFVRISILVIGVAHFLLPIRIDEVQRDLSRR
ncbi:hypothetical protein [Corynebacterium glyciniphilum]|uniref:hypothetical protein n=1 Tax=Corynebacterium glyciniphilum TaxID=1404244 RepID=UPI003FD017B9